ncbi:MAG: DUF4906 domain-containing protein, partial [Mucinivorans sp.]
MHTFKSYLSFLWLLFFVACTKAPLELEETLTQGLPAHVSLELFAQDDELYSRSVSSDAAEQAINNLFVFIFDAATGKQITNRFYKATEFTGASKNTVTIETTSGNRHIYAVGNVDLDIMDVVYTRLQAITSEEELKTFQLTLKQNTLSRGSSFVMSGFIEDAATPATPATVAISGGSTALGPIALKRIDSKIRFNIATLAGVTFTAQDWRVVKAPLHSMLLANTQTDIFEATTDYFTSEWAHFEGEGTAEAGRTFAFYLLENKHTPRAPITATTDAYAFREKQDKDATGHNGLFTYAPTNSTYVQLRGHVSYTGVSADVVYTIHLGQVGTDAVNNYDNLRNSTYTYNVTVNSVSSISTEASSTTGQEPQPGAEGDVTLSSQSFDFDAHYGTTTVSFPKDAIVPGLVWSVKTPFSQGQKSATTTPEDYKWVLFRINAKNSSGAYIADFQPFPGVQNLYTGTPEAYTATTTGLLNVDQLVEVLRYNKAQADASQPNLFDNASPSKISFTAYVDEFYYDQDPTTTVASPTDLWKRFVNQPERILHILSARTTSADGNSVKTDAFFLFRQSSIQTMYSTSYAPNQTAWGTEMIQDENFYIWGTPPAVATYTNNANGRGNTMALWSVPPTNSTLPWTNFITTATGALTTNYTDAIHACMKLNRDNNGNNHIDHDEVRWYLSSINQLSDIWIGEPSLNLRARLYKLATWMEGKQWYTSSTYDSGKGGVQILWSSEGASVGAQSGAMYDAPHPVPGNHNQRWL